MSQDDFPTVVNVETLGGTFTAQADRSLSEAALNALRDGPNQMGPGMQNKRQTGDAAHQPPAVK